MNPEHYRSLRRRFVWLQILRGAVAIFAILGLFVLFDYFFGEHLYKARCYLLSKPHLIYLTFLSSEMLGSLFPPEVFILAISRTSVWVYLWGVMWLSLISYAAALGVYFLGTFVSRTLLFKRFVQRFYKRELRQLRRFGGLIVVLAALTPISFTIICLLVGAIGFPFRQFVWYTMARYLRFILYAYSLWHLTPTMPC